LRDRLRGAVSGVFLDSPHQLSVSSPFHEFPETYYKSLERVTRGVRVVPWKTQQICHGDPYDKGALTGCRRSARLLCRVRPSRVMAVYTRKSLDRVTRGVRVVPWKTQQICLGDPYGKGARTGCRRSARLLCRVQPSRVMAVYTRKALDRVTRGVRVVPWETQQICHGDHYGACFMLLHEQARWGKSHSTRGTLSFQLGSARWRTMVAELVIKGRSFLRIKNHTMVNKLAEVLGFTGRH
jgi:hypothetical protein